MKDNYISVTHQQDLAKECLNINWFLTSVCNFDCSYCPDSLHDGKLKGLASLKILENIDKIMDHYSSRKKFFEFTGGEVSYYKDFLIIAKHIKSHNADVGIISNGSRGLSFWHKLRPFLDHVCLSYHPERKYSDRFLEVVEYLNQTVTVHVNIMMRPEFFDECLDVANRVYNVKGLSLALQPLYEKMKGKKVKYNPEQSKILEQQLNALSCDPDKTSVLKNNLSNKEMKVYRGAMIFTTITEEQEIYGTPQILAQNLNNWKGWYCYAGLENLVIDAIGNVRRSWCGAGNTYLGNINTHVSFPSKPVLCDISNCFCGFDMMCTKVNPKYPLTKTETTISYVKEITRKPSQDLRSHSNT